VTFRGHWFDLPVIKKRLGPAVGTASSLKSSLGLGGNAARAEMRGRYFRRAGKPYTGRCHEPVSLDATRF
jgi:hypothetical protein